jgi:AraC-like DNA-binding protein
VRARYSQYGAIVVNRLKFARAARFLRHIVQHLQTASLSDLRKADLSGAGRAVVALEREQARLRETLRRHMPAAPPVPRSSSPESHAERVVQGLLGRIELDYPNAITLQQLARELGMNAAYLSSLFSRSVGIPFKSYLTELRLQKAKELLDDSAKTVSEIAFAVGYSSEDRFRFAFRKATGLSPKVWRQTMKMSPSGHPA